ncbi:type II toxin-antitoxin system antitoxin SocA domain-containing protein [Candidatus Frankia alpina]|uniref:type II toxin-antitoxin system antitoxin SocA domain-containing protein n=1 Tax=Candidatus Frankia alpina TaxID=2699483 RepID=UPI0013D081F3|nr:type II toxin-antitoxin system antitoxin SocA domain-containing protein [Candidatus Frankia alpina]
MTENVHDVASLIVTTLGDVDTMRLQKLAYYSQAWHLATYGTALFPDEVQAWTFGPVVPQLYSAHRGAYGVRTWVRGDPQRLNDQSRRLVDWVLETYGQLTGEELSRMTHAEAPWLRARAGLDDSERSNEPIDPVVMKDYFSRLRMSPAEAVSAAVGNARLEGYELSASTAKQLSGIAAGERSADDVVREVLARYHH